MVWHLNRLLSFFYLYDDAFVLRYGWRLSIAMYCCSCYYSMFLYLCSFVMRDGRYGLVAADGIFGQMYCNSTLEMGDEING